MATPESNGDLQTALSLARLAKAEQKKVAAKVRVDQRHRKTVEEALFRLYRKPPLKSDHKSNDAWLRGWAQRLVWFGKAATNAGYAGNVLALSANSVAERIAVGLIKLALGRDAKQVLKELRKRPLPSAVAGDWWPGPFNHDRLLLRILSPARLRTSTMAAAKGLRAACRLPCVCPVCSKPWGHTTCVSYSGIKVFRVLSSESEWNTLIALSCGTRLKI
jgi:hypothetical protein